MYIRYGGEQVAAGNIVWGVILERGDPFIFQGK
jgi:hypothetical protein